MNTSEKQQQKLIKTVVGSSCMTFIIVLMILASELFGEKEIIFPEVAAICVGSFITPKVMWRSSFLRIILSITVCAVLGVVVVLYLPLALWLQFSLAFMTAQFIFFFSKTGFAPMISAMALPVLIQANRPIYIVSAVALTTLVLVITLFYQKYILKEGEGEGDGGEKGGEGKKKRKVIKVQIPWHEFIPSFIFRSIIVTIVALVCSRLNEKVKYCMAPPLLVAFTEMTTKKNMPALQRPAMTLVLFTGCAVIGTIARYLFSMLWGLPLTVAVLFVCLGVITLMKSIKLFFPPAAAMGVLSMLIPEGVVLLYPLDVFVGISIWVASALVWKKIQSQKEKRHQQNQKQQTSSSSLPTKKSNAMNDGEKDHQKEEVNHVEIEIENDTNNNTTDNTIDINTINDINTNDINTNTNTKMNINNEQESIPIDH